VLAERGGADDLGRATELAARARKTYQALGLSHYAERAAGPAAPPTAAPARNAFRCEGEVWMIGFAGRVVRLKDAKGFRYLVRLLRHQGRGCT
jgi:hypothetical protein